MQSYAAALKYIKLNTSIPVPEVFDCCSKLEKGNDVGTSYILMERLPGRPLDLQEDVEMGDEQYGPTHAAAEKVFKQLASFIMQLGIYPSPSTASFSLLCWNTVASLQFDKIGSLREQPAGSGSFCIGEYFDAGIVYPQERGEIYDASSFKGPFSTVSEYHSAILSLNENYAVVDKEDEDGDYLRSVQQCRLLQPKMSLPQYENGPFVVHHDDLSSSNLLVRLSSHTFFQGNYLPVHARLMMITILPASSTSLEPLCPYRRSVFIQWSL